MLLFWIFKNIYIVESFVTTICVTMYGCIRNTLICVNVINPITFSSNVSKISTLNGTESVKKLFWRASWQVQLQLLHFIYSSKYPTLHDAEFNNFYAQQKSWRYTFSMSQRIRLRNWWKEPPYHPQSFVSLSNPLKDYEPVIRRSLENMLRQVIRNWYECISLQTPTQEIAVENIH